MASWTKRQVLEQAYAEIGKASYDFDIQPEELQHGLRVLDAMLATWAQKGIRIAWAGGDGYGDVDASTNVPEWATEALYLNLAIRLAPSIGRAVSPDTKQSAKSAYNAVLARCVIPGEMQVRGYAGSGSWYGNVPVADDPLTTATGNVIF